MVPVCARASRKRRAETARLKRLTRLESEMRQGGFEKIAGLDEAGRGPLAGPVVAAACILPACFLLRGINDSKKLTHQRRYRYYQELVMHPGVLFGIGVVEPGEIDASNIAQATFEAMRRAIDHLPIPPDFLLVDGLFVPEVGVAGKSVIGGDRKVQAIAAASILAKVTRDHIMLGYDVLFPVYGFGRHKGYGTQEHFEALRKEGPSPIHRMTFQGVRHD